MASDSHRCNHDHDHSHDHKHDHGSHAGHDHSHHGHDHGHHHHHHGVSGRVGVAFFLNLSFAIIELIGGLWTNSMAVMSDALHDFGDALALGMAWYLERRSFDKSNPRFTYGYRRLSVLSAVITGLILMMGSLWIIGTSFPRLLNPEPVKADGMLGLALLGIAINGLAFWRLTRGESLHEKMLRWHFIEDIFGWVLVLFGSILMLIVDWPWMDPLLAILLSVWVLWNVLKHLRSGLSVFLQVSPQHLSRGQAEQFIRSQPGVLDVHHAHVWTLDGQAHIMTAHVVVDAASGFGELQKLKSLLKRGLRENFGILEATVEFERQGENCEDPAHDGQ